MHLYLAHIFVQLVLHPGSKYAHFYSIRHVVQPYCVTYYARAVLEAVCSPNLAEKILVCVAILVQGCGYRFLAKSLGHTGNLAALLIVPVLIDFPLGAGLLNFYLSVGLAFFVLGLWVRMGESVKLWRLAIFTILIVLMVLIHPVPLLIIAGYICGGLILSVSNARLFSTAYPQSGRKSQWISLAIVALAIVTPAFMARGKTLNSFRDIHPFYMLHGILSLNFLSIVSAISPAGRVYHIALYAMFAVVAGACLWRFLSNAAGRRLNKSDHFFFISLCFCAVIPVLPLQLSGGLLFAQRMVSVAWALVLVPFAGMRLSPKASRFFRPFLAIIVALSLIVWARKITPVARTAAFISSAPIEPNLKGVFLEDGSQSDFDETGLTYPISVYSGIRAFLLQDEILLNTPWMDQTINPVQASRGSALLLGKVSKPELEHPWLLYKALQNPLERQIILNDSQFVLFQENVPENNAPVRLLGQTLNQASVNNWRCSDEGAYALCLKSPMTVRTGMPTAQKASGVTKATPCA